MAPGSRAGTGAHRRAELRQSRFTDGRWLGCGRTGPAACYRVDHARSGVRTVLHCDRGRSAGGREALPGAAAKQLALNLSGPAALDSVLRPNSVPET